MHVLFTCMLIGVSANSGEPHDSDLKETDVEADEENDAKSLFMSGATYFKEGDYSSALVAFAASYRFKPVSTALNNKAMCEMILGRYVEAIDSFNGLFEAHGDTLSPDIREKAEASLEKLQMLVGRLRMDSLPAGAEIWIDDGSATLSEDENEVLLNPGRYHLRVTHVDYRAFETEIRIESGQTVVVQPSLEKKMQPDASEAPPLVPPPADVSNTRKATPPVSPFRSSARMPEDGGPEERRSFVRSYPAGLSVVVAGIAGLGVGGMFTVKQFQNREDALAENRKLVNGGDYSSYEEEFEDIERNRYPQAKRGMIIGYVAGGILVLTGVSMILVKKMRNSRNANERLSWRLTATGVSCDF